MNCPSALSRSIKCWTANENGGLWTHVTGTDNKIFATLKKKEDLTKTKDLIRRRLRTPEHQRSRPWNLCPLVPTALDCISLPLSREFMLEISKRISCSRYLTLDKRETRPQGQGRRTDEQHRAWVWNRVFFQVFVSLFHCESRDPRKLLCINAQEQYGGGKRRASFCLWFLLALLYKKALHLQHAQHLSKPKIASLCPTQAITL